MHVLVSAGKSLGEDDVLVANWGLHPGAVDALPMALRWWAEQRARGRALPALVWRETSARHWPASSGYLDTSACVPFGASADRDEPDANTAGAFAKAAAAAELSVGDGRVETLPVHAPSRPRHDEHPVLYWYHRPKAQQQMLRNNGSYVADCTHICEQSSTFRMYNAALLTLLARLRRTRDVRWR
uniref:Uncharacterized protein n=1 Tax=Calcidiscus leptoporus TaxID=127549 RepID=A0A7S0JGQ9_9EUKA|mmetsp:Transcript_57478/g.131991  ORF Transcript_57478/g.131991 Transcript_57478/m.131991 type:complete len:185 (+) Transcript_57478:635-1189(+)